MELIFKEVSKDFAGVNVVHDITYTMKRGVYGLLGVNGAGKTTLMRMLCTVTCPTSGEIMWNGENIFRLGASYRDILGYLPQDFGYYPDLSVFDYMMYIASIKGIHRLSAREKTEQLLGQVGLLKYKKQKMKNLSGGMVRRVGIAQAMLNNPKILVLDEPTAGLDPNERVRFRNLISELAEKRLVLLSTHIVSDVEYIANEIILMREGEFFYTGTPEEMVSSVSENVWHCTVERKDVEFFLKHYRIGNMKTIPEGAELRILSETAPTEGAVRETATLEDAFLFYFGEKGEMDV